MLNVVTGKENIPQAILIRGVENYNGPGKLTKSFGIDRSFYGEDLMISERIWFEDDGISPAFKTGPRIGINYAGEYWKTRPWRYFIEVKLPEKISLLKCCQDKKLFKIQMKGKSIIQPFQVDIIICLETQKHFKITFR